MVVGERAGKIGRNYRIDYFDSADMLSRPEAVLLDRLTEENKQTGKGKNISGFIDHLANRFKNPGTWLIPYKDIPAYLRKRDTDTYSHCKRFGILYFSDDQTKFDLVGSSGNVLIPRGTQVVEIRIPEVIFQEGKKGWVTPGVFTESLAIAADYYFSNKLNTRFVIGLTHPRLGEVARRRWNFSEEARPFPAEIYQLLDLGLKDEKDDPERAQNLESLRNQVLVYQTIEDFTKSASTNLALE